MYSQDTRSLFMKILLTGANGYIGKHLLPLLVEQGHTVFPLVRQKSHLTISKKHEPFVHILEADLLDAVSLEKIPTDIEAAYYLVHSMKESKQFADLEIRAAENFKQALEKTQARQILYLSGLVNEQHLSPHLQSRKKVGEILRGGKTPVTILMAGIIIGAGSASFEIIRDLSEKLPLMIAPKWVTQQIQPIAVRDVLAYLLSALGDSRCFDQSFEIGGPDVMSYRDLLLQYAKIRGLSRSIWTVPFLTPHLSAYWLVLITSTNFSLARSLIESLINNVVCKERKIELLFPRKLLTYEEAVRLSLAPLEDDWMVHRIEDPFYREVPRFGTLSMQYSFEKEDAMAKIQARKSDFGRLLLEDLADQRLLFYKDQGKKEVWIEWTFSFQTTGSTHLKVVFRPLGVLDRFFWKLFYPFLKWGIRRWAKRCLN